MLVVKVEVWPGGDSSRAKEIARAGVANVSSLREVSDYIVIAQNDNRATTEGMVVGHNRSDGAWKLVQEIARVADSLDEDIKPIPEKLDETHSYVESEMLARTNPLPVGSMRSNSASSYRYQLAALADEIESRRQTK